MLDCRNATRLISESQERPLSFMERFSLRIHLAMCSGCSNFNDQMGSLRLMARSFAKREDSEK